MPEEIVRKNMSTLGFCLILYLILGNVIASVVSGFSALIVVIGRMTGRLSGDVMSMITSLTSSSWYALTLNAVVMYVISMPLVAWIIRSRIPTSGVRRWLPGYAELPAGQDAAFRQSAGEKPIRLRDIPALIPICVFFMAAGSTVSSVLASLIGDIAGVEASNSQVEMLLSGNLLATILFVVIIAPVAEELFFRKLIIDTVRPAGRRAAVFVSAFSFALFHTNLFQFFYAFFLGLLLALVYIKTRNVLIPILMHMLLNFSGGVILPYVSKDLLVVDTGVLRDGSPEQMLALVRDYPMLVAFLIIYSLLSFAGMVILLIWMAKGRFRLVERYDAVPYGTFLGAFFTAPGQILYILVCIVLSVVMLVMNGA
ncbi:MAG: CPBP family intramembrane metalloprotease [Lachnospiraceae bacterium]|nr:CPBP family intramembrane metalloprotease [Lachnospiraceae bacterium]